ncbi:MAG: hypothetical protein GY771_02170 [bacterium]|nr:hypothetical protein [bacterium]
MSRLHILMLLIRLFTTCAAAINVEWSGYLRDDLAVYNVREGFGLVDEGYRMGNYLRLRIDMDATVNDNVYVSATPQFTYLSGIYAEDFNTGLPIDEFEVGLTRAQADYFSDHFQLTLGKQRLKISQALFFSPLDIFNPVDFTEPTTERDGVLAGRATIYAVGNTGARFIYIPEEQWNVSPKAVKLFTTIWNFDLGLSYIETGWYDISMAGFDFNGSAGDFGFYGEAVYELRNEVEGIEDGNFRAAVGGSYGWENGPSFFVEYYRDERGAVDPLEYDLNELFLGHRFTLGRDYAGGMVTYSPHPLFLTAFTGLVNANDESYYLNPSVTWNALESVDLILDANYFDGGTMSEYYYYPPFYRLQVFAYF